MMSEEAPSQTLVDSSQQQTQANTSTGGGAESLPPQSVVSSLMPDSPPAYSNVAKEQEAQLNEPPVTYMPAVYPSGGVPLVQYVIAAPVRPIFPKPNFPGPHGFLLFILVTMIICAILNVSSLIFGIPAFTVALMGRYFRETKRNYLKASRYSTIAVGLAIWTICYTLFLSFLITVLPTIFSSGKSNGYVFSCRILEHNNYGSRGNYEYVCSYN